MLNKKDAGLVSEPTGKASNHINNHTEGKGMLMMYKSRRLQNPTSGGSHA